jgi:hypothetical protein
VRRRRFAAAAVSVLVLAVGGAACRSGATETKPAPRPQPSATPRVEVARPLTYAEGRTIHLGARTIDTGQDLLSLDVTDDGVAFTTFDGGLWFTDGRSMEQIGAMTPGSASPAGIAWGPDGRPNDRIVSGNTGSRLAWLQYSEFGRPGIVVYDTRQRRRVAAFTVEQRSGCARCAQLVSVSEDDVYWTDGLWRGAGGEDLDSSARLFRYRVSTGVQKAVSARSYDSYLRSRPRMLVLGESVESGRVQDGIGQDFAFVGRRLVASGRGTGRPSFDPVSGRQLQVRPPNRFGYGYGAAERLYLFQWLDDDSFALLDGTGWNRGALAGEDLLVCHISLGRCRVAVHRPASAGSPIVPEISTPGAERAQVRAAGSTVSGS